jgi:hypothetical protein
MVGLEKKKKWFFDVYHHIKTDAGSAFALIARFLAIYVHLLLYPIVDVCNV